MRTLGSWPEVSTWLAALNEPSGPVAAAVAQAGHRLVQGAQTRSDSVSAIARFAQGIHYASIQVGVARGGGYRAHPAAEVMAKAYGDCKDKSNLMRDLLRVIGIPAWLAVVYSGDPQFVREEWPSPRQFNHCIVAIQRWEGGPILSSVGMPGADSLVLFDPTDPYTPFGSLPSSIQGSLALVVARNGGGLVRVPQSLPEQDLMQRRVHLTLSSDGAVEGRVEEESSGLSAAGERRLVEAVAPEEYREIVREWLWRCAGATDVGNIAFAEDSVAQRFTLRVDFHAEHWGQLASAGLLVFRPSLSDREPANTAIGQERSLPFMLKSTALRESVFVHLPAGHALDEVPRPAQISASFGDYASTAEVRDGALICARRLTIRPGPVPVDRYREVQEFFRRAAAAENSAVVLIRR